MEIPFPQKITINKDTFGFAKEIYFVRREPLFSIVQLKYLPSSCQDKTLSFLKVSELNI